MEWKNIGLLGYALLGLLQQRPASGYDLRKIFADTPMGNFSDSPGAIYPALRRLEAARLIRGKLEAGSSRQRNVFMLTQTGLKRLHAWLLKPVEQEDVSHRMNELMLRFAFIGGAVSDRAAMDFLQAMHDGLKNYVGTLKGFLKKGANGMPLSARLALESGILGYEAQLGWAARGVETYKKMIEREAI